MYLPIQIFALRVDSKSYPKGIFSLRWFQRSTRTDTDTLPQRHFLAKVASTSFMDHWLDQRLRVDCPRRIWRTAGEPTHRGHHILHASELRSTTLAPVFDIHWLQPLCILAQCFWEFTAPLRDESRFRVVNFWIRHHLYHCLGLLVSKLRKWPLCFRHLHKRYVNYQSVFCFGVYDRDGSLICRISKRHC